MYNAHGYTDKYIFGRLCTLFINHVFIDDGKYTRANINVVPFYLGFFFSCVVVRRCLVPSFFYLSGSSRVCVCVLYTLYTQHSPFLLIPFSFFSSLAIVCCFVRGFGCCHCCRFRCSRYQCGV